MKKNMGNVDRLIRISLAIVIGTLYFMKLPTGTTGVVLIVFATAFLITSLTGFCPLYIPFGFTTLKRKT